MRVRHTEIFHSPFIIVCMRGLHLPMDPTKRNGKLSTFSMTSHVYFKEPSFWPMIPKFRKMPSLICENVISSSVCTATCCAPNDDDALDPQGPLLLSSILNSPGRMSRSRKIVSKRITNRKARNNGDSSVPLVGSFVSPSLLLFPLIFCLLLFL